MEKTVHKNDFFKQSPMDDLLELMASEARTMDALFASDLPDMLSSHTSCIKHHGRPILPPLMTAERHEEMSMYKRQAIMVETRIRALSRQKLLARVQNVMSEIELQHNRPVSSDLPQSAQCSEAPTSSSDDVQTIIDAADREPPDKGQSVLEPPSDSGFSSKPSTAADTLRSEEPVDTMADVSDISDEGKEEVADARGLEGPVASTPIDMEEREEELKDEDAERKETDSEEDTEIEQTTKLESDQLEKILTQAEDDVDDDSVKYEGADNNGLTVAQQPESKANPMRRSVVDMLLSANADAKARNSDKQITIKTKEDNRKVDVTESEYYIERIVEQLLSDHVVTNIIDSGIKSTTSSSTTTSGESEEMSGTVIVKTRVVENAESVEEVTSLPTVDPKLRLLSRVDFSEDTPVGTPAKVISKGNDSASNNAEIVEDLEVVQGPVSPGPLSTPNLSDISTDQDDALDDEQQENVGDPRLASGDEITQTADLNTESTELAGYMVGNSHATLSSQTTMPHFPTDPTSSITPIVEGEETAKDRTESDVSSFANTEEGSTPRSARDNTKPVKGTIPQQEPDANVTVASRILNQSFTLDHPSPVLLAAEARKSQNSSTARSKSSQARKTLNRSSSIEDLKLKSQRKLDYEDNAIQVSVPARSSVVDDDDTEEDGKQEHLQRYLEAISQMPNTGQMPEADREQEIEQFKPESPQHEQLQSEVLHGSAGLSAEALLQTQMSHFEQLKEQLLKQQQQQLAALLAEQQKQQLIFQQEILNQERARLSTSSRLSGSGRPNSSQSDYHSPNELTKQKYNDYAIDEVMHANQQTRHRKTDARSQSPPSQQIRATVPASPMAEKQKQRYDTWMRAPPPPAEPDSMHFAHSRLHGNEDDDDSFRPMSAPAPKVSFHVDDASKSSSPAGVYYSPPPLPGETSILEEDDDQQAAQDRFPSPAVLYKRRARSQSSTSEHDVSFQNAGSSKAMSHAVTPSGQPASILKKPSPVQQPLIAVPKMSKPATIMYNGKAIPYDLHEKFCKVGAAVRGYLTRRLLRTERVQNVIATIRDTAEFAIHFQQESPIKRGVYSAQDRLLQDRVLNQLDAAMYEIHDIFFGTSVSEQMHVIHQDRLMLQDRTFKTMPANKSVVTEPKKVSAATQKAMDRKKKMQLAEASVFGDVRPKSAPPPSTSSPRQHRATDIRSVKTVQARNSPREQQQSQQNTSRPGTAEPTKKKSIRKVHVQAKPKPKTSTAAPGLKKPASSATTTITARKVAKGASTNRARAGTSTNP